MPVSRDVPWILVGMVLLVAVSIFVASVHSINKEKDETDGATARSCPDGWHLKTSRPYVPGQMLRNCPGANIRRYSKRDGALTMDFCTAKCNDAGPACKGVLHKHNGRWDTCWLKRSCARPRRDLRFRWHPKVQGPETQMCVTTNPRLFPFESITRHFKDIKVDLMWPRATMPPQTENATKKKIAILGGLSWEGTHAEPPREQKHICRQRVQSPRGCSAIRTAEECNQSVGIGGHLCTYYSDTNPKKCIPTTIRCKGKDRPVESKFLHVNPGNNLHGGALLTYPQKSSLATCKQQCKDDSGCVGAMYNKNGHCMLMSSHSPSGNQDPTGTEWSFYKHMPVRPDVQNSTNMAPNRDVNDLLKNAPVS